MSRGLLGIASLEHGAVEGILERCAFWRDPANAPGSNLQGRPIAALFSSLSTSTRPAFEAAAQRTGSTISWAPSGESLTTLLEIAGYMRSDAIVMAHPAPGTPELLARRMDSPVINAGDGAHEHPVPALAIASALLAQRPKRVAIIGDIRHSGLARSLVHLFSTLGVETALCGPPTLCPPELARIGKGCKVHSNLERALDGAETIIGLPAPVAHPHELPFPESEYAAFYRLGPEHLVPGRPLYSSHVDGALPLRDSTGEAAAWIAALEYVLPPK